MGEFFNQNLLAAFYTGLLFTFLMGMIVGMTFAYLWGRVKKRNDWHAG